MSDDAITDWKTQTYILTQRQSGGDPLCELIFPLRKTKRPLAATCFLHLHTRAYLKQGFPSLLFKNPTGRLK